jgi:histidinol phosphatase-like PHP family hydrolase
VKAIRKLNDGFENFRLFTGVECDILRNGSLDFDDETLAGLDYVVASVHSAFNLSEAEMTRRIIGAISDPYITMLAHPTGRLLLKREPYVVDIPALLDAAAETGTWIEINAAPKRLDLDWRSITLRVHPRQPAGFTRSGCKTPNSAADASLIHREGISDWERFSRFCLTPNR